MKMALQGTTLLIKDADNVQFNVIQSWNKMKWDKKSQTLRGMADMELLDKLSSIVRLPPAIEQRRQNLHIIQEAVDRERTKANVSGNPFTVTFENLDNLVVQGVWNATQKRIEF